MKRIILAAASLLLCLQLSACKSASAPAPVSDTQPAAGETAPSLPAQDAQLPEENQPPVREVETLPAQPDAGSETPVAVQEELTLRADIEESVSYEIILPKPELDNEAATAYFSALMDDLAASLVSYAEQTVFPAAQEKQTIASFTCSYTLTRDGTTLYLHLTRTESYANEEAPIETQKTFAFDSTTGTFIE